jgi:hypothetical protein
MPKSCEKIPTFHDRDSSHHFSLSRPYNDSKIGRKCSGGEGEGSGAVDSQRRGGNQGCCKSKEEDKSLQLRILSCCEFFAIWKRHSGFREKRRAWPPRYSVVKATLHYDDLGSIDLANKAMLTGNSS